MDAFRKIYGKTFGNLQCRAQSFDYIDPRHSHRHIPNR
jgi:hypothetical protein